MAKEEVKATAAKATEAVKETAKVAETKAKATVKKTEAKAKTAVKAAETKATATKAAAKKTVAKAAAKTVAVKAQTIVQFQNKEVDLATVEERVKAAFVAEGNKASAIKTINIYVKPEEYSAYYVINGKFSGRVDLF